MTYSLGVKGARADALPFAPETLTIDDAQALTGGMQRAMQLGTPFLCKRPDGSQGYFTFDAERSTPDAPILKAV